MPVILPADAQGAWARPRGARYRHQLVPAPTAVNSDWAKVFPDPLNAQVIAERLTERSEHFVLEKGYRPKP